MQIYWPLNGTSRAAALPFNAQAFESGRTAGHTLLWWQSPAHSGGMRCTKFSYPFISQNLCQGLAIPHQTFAPRSATLKMDGFACISDIIDSFERLLECYNFLSPWSLCGHNIQINSRTMGNTTFCVSNLTATTPIFYAMNAVLWHCDFVKLKFQLPRRESEC